MGSESPLVLEQNQLDFLAEAVDGLSQIERAIITSLAKHQVEMRWTETMRLVHSLKGGAGMLGFEHLGQAAHHLEDALYQIRQDPSRPASDTIRTLLGLVDCIKEIIRLNQMGLLPTTSWMQEQVEPLIEFLIRDLGKPDEDEMDPDLLEDDEAQFIKIAFETEIAAYLEQLDTALLDESSQYLTERAFKISSELESLGYMLNLDDLIQISKQVDSQLTAAPEQVVDIVRDALVQWRALQNQVLRSDVDSDEQLENEASLDPRLPSETAPTHISSDKEIPSTMRVDNRNLDELSNELEEMRIYCNSLTVRLQRLEQIIARFGEYTGKLSLTQDALRLMYDQLTPTFSLNPDGFDPLEMDRYNPMHPIWQEMIELSVRLQEVHSDTELVTQDLESTVNQLSHTSGIAQKRLHRSRMQPMAGILHTLQRSTWEIADRLGKQVELEFRGEKTLLERHILEKLRDPLMHLLRNALDHGIEHPEERQSKGKSPQGKITITAETKRNQICITVKDDGRGIDLDKLKEKTGHALSDNTKLMEAIFEPGFSTAEMVTEISGRGVGLDVVKSYLEAMGGRVEVESQLHQGTQFLLTIPSSLSTVRALIVERNGLLMGIPTRHVIQLIVAGTATMLEGTDGTVLKLGENMLIQKLELLDKLAATSDSTLSHVEEPATVNYPCLLLLSYGNRVGFIQTDRCWKERELITRQVEGMIALPAPLGGCSILGTGQILPLLNVGDLFNQKLSAPKRISTPKWLENRSSLLIVDDSIHVRQHLCRALQKQGFQTIEAKDGQEAIEKLRAGLEVQGVVSDLEMPRLDGYGLLEALKGDPRWAPIPVVVLTSRSGKKHRQRVMELGATSYIVKPCRENELIEHLHTVMGSSDHVYSV